LLGNREENIMRILTYKRTHIGDPDATGRFGVYDCMGRVRDYAFDAVIGVGGIGIEPRTSGIDRRINWVGIYPKREVTSSGRGQVVTFEWFLLLEGQGPLLESLAPQLARRMYEGGARLLLHCYSELEFEEAKAILNWSQQQKQPKEICLPRTNDKSSCAKRCRIICSERM